MRVMTHESQAAERLAAERSVALREVHAAIARHEAEALKVTAKSAELAALLGRAAVELRAFANLLAPARHEQKL